MSVREKKDTLDAFTARREIFVRVRTYIVGRLRLRHHAPCLVQAPSSATHCLLALLVPLSLSRFPFSWDAGLLNQRRAIPRMLNQGTPKHVLLLQGCTRHVPISQSSTGSRVLHTRFGTLPSLSRLGVRRGGEFY